MLRDITLGQYYQTDSILHRMDPRTKLVGTFIFIISIFIKKNIFVFTLATIFLIATIALSKVPVKFIFRGMKPILAMLIFTVVLNLFMYGGDTVLWQWKFIKITKEGLINAGYMGARIALLVIGASIMTLTTKPTNLTDGLEHLLHPLVHIKVPVHEVAMMMSIALRFIPILMDETDKIMKAQLARGADFENGNVIKRIKSYIPIMIPLFISSFRRAGDMAMAMEARCYKGGSGRTKMKPLKYHKRDVIAYVVLILFLTGAILLAIYTNVKPEVDISAIVSSITME